MTCMHHGEWCIWFGLGNLFQQPVAVLPLDGFLGRRQLLFQIRQAPVLNLRRRRQIVPGLGITPGQIIARQGVADFGAAMLADRNRAWLPVILDTLAGTDKPVIAAFGAAHLGGEDGVLNLLAQEGFTLTREPF